MMTHIKCTSICIFKVGTHSFVIKKQKMVEGYNGIMCVMTIMLQVVVDEN